MPLFQCSNCRRIIEAFGPDLCDGRCFDPTGNSCKGLRCNCGEKHYWTGSITPEDRAKYHADSAHTSSRDGAQSGAGPMSDEELDSERRSAFVDHGGLEWKWSSHKVRRLLLTIDAIKAELERQKAAWAKSEALFQEIERHTMPDRRGRRRRTALDKVTDLVMTRPFQQNGPECPIFRAALSTPASESGKGLTIREAVQSGRPFKRPIDSRWFTAAEVPGISFQAECLMATDWEIQEERS